MIALLGAALSVITTTAASANVLAPACGGCGGDDGGGDDGGGGSGGGGSGSGGGGGGGVDRTTNTTLSVTGACGDLLILTGGKSLAPIDVSIAIPTTDQSEVWDLTGTLQWYDAVTGAPFGDPITLGKATLSSTTLNSADSFSTTGTVANTPGLTKGISYTLTRTSPTPETCTNAGFWTNPDTLTSWGPTPENPTGFPGEAPS